MALLTDCETCTPPQGSSTILTVDIPGGLAINLLGIHIEVCPICISVFVDGNGALTAQQQSIANSLIQTVKNVVPSIPSV